MNKAYQKGDPVKLLPTPQLLEVFNQTQVFTNIVKKRVSKEIGETEGIIYDTFKDNDDNFFFQATNGYVYLIPYQSIAQG
ncbi:MAG: hypothetical protein WCJ45_00805 [bacterium]